MGMRSRRKGKLGEVEAAKALTRLFGVEAHRGRQYQGGEDSPDVAHSIAGVHVEVKRCERLSLYEAIQQASEEAGTKSPIVLHRRNNREWLAIVMLDDLPEIVTQLYLTMVQNAELPRATQAKALQNALEQPRAPSPGRTARERKPSTSGKPGVGVIRGNEAVDCLMRIPKNDPLKERGFQIVTDWIKRNR